MVNSINSSRDSGIKKSIARKANESAAKLLPNIKKLVITEINKNNLTLEQAIDKVFSSDAVNKLYPAVSDELVKRILKQNIRRMAYGPKGFYVVIPKKENKNKFNDDGREL